MRTSPTPSRVSRPARHAATLLLALAGALGGCAALNRVDSQVATYGDWPADRRPSTFAFDRLPSQQVRPGTGAMIETAARGALEQIGFRAVDDPQQADTLVQVGARVASDDPWIYDAPLFSGWGGFGYPYGRWGGWGGGWGPGWGGYYGSGWGGWNGPYGIPSFERQVVLVIRDRRSGRVLYETRAENTGPSPDIGYLLPAMFAAALKEFPRVDATPRRVETPIERH